MDYYHIAGLTVAMTAAGRTARQAAPYLASACPGPADLTVSCDTARILAANPWLENAEDAQYMGTGACFARQLIDFNGFQLHASAVALEGRAWLFSGPCGIGKSTLTERWVRIFGAVMLNDDKPALRLLPEGWRVYGTPWSGKWDKSAPLDAPLGGVAFLNRAEENAITQLTHAQVLPMLLSQMPRGLDRAHMERLLELADELLRRVPMWRLTCRNEDAAAALARAEMIK